MQRKREVSKNSDSIPRLQFLPSSTADGFLNSTVSGERLSNISEIVRELIQNSTDAAREAGHSEARVDFAFDEVQPQQIPGIDDYKKALEYCQEVHAHIDNCLATIEKIRHQLESDRVRVLNIFDNGVGLNVDRMNRLLGDGITSKTEDWSNSGGSYGVGHLTAFGASDMRYILYGGVTPDSKRTMSGHAILASHFPPPPQFNGKPESGLRGKDGYFIHGLDSTKRSLSNRLVFPSDSAIPAFVGQKLSFLQNKYQSGSVVSILGFNAFNLKDVSQDNINNEIFRAVARNFFISILEKKLVVVCDGEEMTRTALEKVMQDDKCQKRRNSEIEVISGSKSYSDYVTVKTGKKETIGTEYGNFDLHYRLADSDESMRISLYRQGMYITDSMPHNKPAQYGKFKPFNAVISIEDGPKQANKAFQLIRGSEGPKHLEIRAERLLKSDRDQFLGLFRQINEQIRLRCTEESTDEFTPSIFDIVLNSGKSKPPPATTESRTGGSGNATPVDETTDGVGPGNEGGRTNGGGDPIGRKLVRNRCLIKVAAKRDQESIRLIIDSEKTIDGARLYLGVHSGSDATCSSPLNDDPIKFKLVSIDGNVVNSSGAKSKAVGVIERDKPKQISLELLDEVPRDAVIKVSIGNDGAAKR